MLCHFGTLVPVGLEYNECSYDLVPSESRLCVVGNGALTW